MFEVEGEARTYTLRGQQFQISSPAWQCPDTGERYNSPEQGDIFLVRLHRAWRERNGIDKDALRQRRKALGLSAAQMSALLGFGVNQYRTYEKTDKLPSKSNAVLLRLLLSDKGLASLLAVAPESLSANTRRKVKAHSVDQLPSAIARKTRPVFQEHVFTALVLDTDQSGGSLSSATEQLGTLTEKAFLEDAGDYSYAMAA
jgi:putative zinc finger/helix-turn-helix YgiT family protein